uniref:Uncharacterized protein n=1 Tax=Rhizophora mucronata TaxID=61149 RepID=A0A2P2R422_RHIMU
MHSAFLFHPLITKDYINSMQDPYMIFHSHCTKTITLTSNQQDIFKSKHQERHIISKNSKVAKRKMVKEESQTFNNGV